MNIILNYLQSIPKLLSEDILSIDPTKITYFTIDSSYGLFYVSFVPKRRNRNRITSNLTKKNCPLCNDALIKGNLGKNFNGWQVTVNRFPGLRDELLIVKSEHNNSFDINDLVALSNVANKLKVKILYSSGINSIPWHKHGCITISSLPLERSRFRQITKNIGITSNYSAKLFVITGELSSRIDNANDIIIKLLERQIEYNLIICPDRIFIHPIKKFKPRNLKTIGPREVAGYFTTSRREFFNKIKNDPKLIHTLLSESSYSSTELKNILSNDFYSYVKFYNDSKLLSKKIKEYCREKKFKIDHIVGVTRGGIALAAIMMTELKCDSISLVGCYLEKTQSNKEIVHWKTPVTKTRGRVILVTSDLIRSGKIVKKIVDKIRETNQGIKSIILVAHHLFKGKVEIYPDFVSHIISCNKFITYPWESKESKYNTKNHPDLPFYEFNKWASEITNEIISITKKTNRKITEIIGFGAVGIMGASIFSQRLGVNKIYGYNESGFKLSKNCRDKYIRKLASIMTKQGSIKNGILISLNYIDSTNLEFVKDIIVNLNKFLKKKIYAVGFDTPIGCPKILMENNIPQKLSIVFQRKKVTWN